MDKMYYKECVVYMHVYQAMYTLDKWYYNAFVGSIKMIIMMIKWTYRVHICKHKINNIPASLDWEVNGKVSTDSSTNVIGQNNSTNFV